MSADHIPYVDARRALWCVLRRFATARARRRPWNRGPFVAQVADWCGLGATSAHALCLDLGLSPETGLEVRGRGWEVPRGPTPYHLDALLRRARAALLAVDTHQLAGRVRDELRRVVADISAELGETEGA